MAAGGALGGIRQEAEVLKEEYARMEAKLREMEQKMLQKVRSRMSLKAGVSLA